MKTNLLILVTVLLTLYSTVVKSQTAVIDSLKHEIQNAEDGSQDIELLLLLVKEFQEISQDSVQQIFEKIDQIIDLSENSKESQLYFLQKGQSAMNSGSDTEAVELFSRAHHLAIENNEWGNLLMSKFKLLVALKGIQPQDKAINQGIDALKYESENPDPIMKPKIYNSLAGAYLNLGQVEKAIEHYETALGLFEENKDSSSVVLVLANLAGIYSRQKDNDKSLKAYFDALKVAEKVSDPRVISSLNRDICLTYMMLRKIDSAEYFIQRAIDISKEVDIPDLVMENTIMQCLIFSKSGKCDQAIPILDTLLVRSQDLENLRWEQNVLHVISDCQVKEKDYDEAIETF